MSIDDRPPTSGDLPTNRPIRSFVRRIGRITPAQQRAFDAHWPRYGIDFAAEVPDHAAMFGRVAPLIVEIGFGNGEQLLHAAGAEMQANFIGVEVHTPGIGRLMNGLSAAGLDNVRIYAHDAVDVLRDAIAVGSLDQVRIYFPDPWPKARHNKRRLVQPALVELVASRLRDGGLLHLATDWAPYAEHMLDVLESSPSFHNELGPRAIAERPAWRIRTHFEQRGRRLGHGVWDFLYRRG